MAVFSDAEVKEMFDYFKPHKNNQFFNNKLDYGRQGELAAQQILQTKTPYTVDWVGDLKKPYDLLLSNGDTIEVKRSTSMKQYNTAIFEIFNRYNYQGIGWWTELINSNTTYISFITDDLQTLYLLKVDDIKEYINFNFYKHDISDGNILIYVPLSALQKLKSYLCYIKEAK